jgi:hypothetical protein
VTQHGSVLPIPDDPRIAEWVSGWPWIVPAGEPFPRSWWLSHVEAILAQDYAAQGVYASSRDRNVTARSLAPFPLAEHDW